MCDSAVRLVRKVASNDREVIVTDLHRDADAASKAAEYGERTVPAVVVDGSLVSCRRNSGPRREYLASALT